MPGLPQRISVRIICKLQDIQIEFGQSEGALEGYVVAGTQTFSEINESKVNFDNLYTSDDPREYFRYLGQLDYIIPHLAQPVFEQLIRIRTEGQAEPVTVLDLGCSYGVNGALLKYALGFDALRERYTAPSLQALSSAALLELDQNFYKSWPRHRNVRVIGLDISRNAVRYAQACGTLDLGMAIDLEAADPAPEDAELLAGVDLIVSTGCVGYVTAKTFERVTRLTRHGRTPWVASFVLRMFPYDQIEATLSAHGLVTEKFEGTTFVQRRFANREEMEATVRAVEARGIDTRGHEANGLYHADLFVSRPPDEIARRPLPRLVNVVSGANKPWPVSTKVLGGYGPSARKRARSERPHLTLARAP
jgi:SAM-dependent methyltransferase